MVLFPNAKINIGLNIIRKRDDGYHDLETVYYPIGLRDGLEFIENRVKKINLSSSGIQLELDLEQNIVVKAYRLLAADYPLPGLDIHIHKAIPFGAGLGGGSSDAAFMLKGINTYFDLGLTVIQLTDYALQLGADCPFFIENKPAFASGAGEILRNIDLSLKGYWLILLKPPRSVATKEAFARITPSTPIFHLSDSIQKPVENWMELIQNDFEPSVFSAFPEIAQLKSLFISRGAIYSAMSGSGSSVLGLFNHDPGFESSDFPFGYFIWKETI